MSNLFNKLPLRKGILMVCFFSAMFWGSQGSVLADLCYLNSAGAGCDIGLGVSNYLKKYLAQRDQKAYLNNAYSPKFEQDPFRATLKDMQWKSMELIVGWIEEITTQLGKKNCSLTQKQISTILYAFDGDFRAEMNYLTSQGTNKYTNKVPQRDDIEKACVAYNKCYYAPGTFGGDVMTDCRNKVVSWYRKGYQQKERLQNVATIQVGKDKYWNSSLEDSPYDLMYDLSMIAKIMFEDVQEPPQILFYHMPNFTNKGNSSSPASSSGERTPPTPSRGSGAAASTGVNSSTGSNSSSVNIPNSSSNPSSNVGSSLSFAEDDDEFNDFLGGNQKPSSSTSSSQSTLFGGNICMGELDEIADSSPAWNTSPSTNIPVPDDISDEEYQEYIDDLKEQLNSYLQLTGNAKPSTWTSFVASGDFMDISTGEDFENAVKKVQSCYASCEGMSVDKKAACMTLCTCGEWSSPVFDPYKTPWLWPIMKVKFCAVPVSPKSFSNGIYVYSIESIFNELFAILDKLDRSGELWIFEKQQEFLDLPASNMDFKMITFSMDQSVRQQVGTNSTSEYFKKEAGKAQHDNLREVLGIKSSLANPVSVNDYVLVQNPSALAASATFSAQRDYQRELKQQQALQKTLGEVASMQQSLFNERYVQLWSLLYGFIYQHFIFWVDSTALIQEFSDIAHQLSLKK